MIIGFVPEDSDIPMDVFYANSFLINNTIKTDKELDCSIISVYNFSNSCSSTVSDSYFSGYIGIGLYDSNLNYIKTIDKEYISQLRFHDTYVDGFTRVDFPTPEEPKNTTVLPFKKYFLISSIPSFVTQLTACMFTPIAIL